MENFNRSLMEAIEVDIDTFIEILEDFQIFEDYYGIETFIRKVQCSNTIVYYEPFECYCLTFKVESETVYVRIPILDTKPLQLQQKIYNLNRSEVENIKILILSFSYSDKSEYILKTSDAELRNLILFESNFHKLMPVKIYFKDYKIISVSKTVQKDSENNLYLTLYKEDKSSFDIFFSKEASPLVFYGQVVKKGFFDNICIAKYGEMVYFQTKI